jgi:hypothetical protein
MKSGKAIVLDQHEVQSGLNRVKWAENLLRQYLKACPGHEGVESWLLNYAGEKTEVINLTAPGV